MSLQPGHKLAHYEILEPIGKGGMGEVYRAKDSKLGRDVAIKVLPDEFAQDEERLRRFQREAKVLALLNHPNIASIYGLEQSDKTHYLVLELVPGETLAQRISRGPIPVEEALDIAAKITEALEEAHEQGIVHRDLKPANVKQTEDGKIKVLDFGLAKVFQEETPDADSSMSPTLTRDATRVGVILGTAAYMSPEQAKGKRVDKRTDIFAFGAVLFEMLTGGKAFPGADVSETLASVIKLEPDWGNVPASSPVALRRLLRRCLEKNPGERLHDIADARLELRDALTEDSAPAPVRATSRALLVLGAVALASLGIAVWALWSLTRSSEVPSRPLARYAISLPANEELAVSGAGPAIAISPDGQTFAWIGSGTQQLYVRRASELEAEPLAGTEGARDVFFSPDGQWLGFTTAEWLMKISISGGAPVRITEQHWPRGATWAPDGSIVFSDRDGLNQVSADGGKLAILATPDRERREKSFRFPDVLPDGKAVVFTAGDADMETWDEGVISVLSLETGEIHPLVDGGTNVRYSPTGHLIYALGNRLLAVAFDATELAVTGAPVPILQEVSTHPANGPAQFAISRDGSLLYAPGGQWESRRRVVSVDRAGRTEPLIEPLRDYGAPHVSPDGQFLALSVDSANVSIWTYSFARDTLTRLVSGFNNGSPKWSPDGRRLAFSSDPEGKNDLFWIPSDGSGQPEPLHLGEYQQFAESWSPGGDFLLYIEVHPDTGLDIGVLSIGRDEPARAFLRTNADEMAPRFSPDGRWVAHQSDESGRPEIYIRPFANPAIKWQVSTDGGTDPAWNPQGGEIFYRDGDKMMVVDVALRETPQLGKPRLLFEGHFFDSALGGAYDVMPDGRYFIMLDDSASEPRPTGLILVENWFEELERLVPTDQ